jgi:hypothetical protein
MLSSKLNYARKLEKPAFKDQRQLYRSEHKPVQNHNVIRALENIYYKKVVVLETNYMKT